LVVSVVVALVESFHVWQAVGDDKTSVRGLFLLTPREVT